MVADEQDDNPNICTHPDSALRIAGPSATGPQFYVCEQCGESLTPELLQAVRDLEGRAFNPESLLNPVDGTPID
jgi:hypothetical protein